MTITNITRLLYCRVSIQRRKIPQIIEIFQKIIVQGYFFLGWGGGETTKLNIFYFKALF